MLGILDIATPPNQFDSGQIEPATNKFQPKTMSWPDFAQVTVQITQLKAKAYL
jgi:hypothetical protein